jgi:hypothetical protein
MVGKISLLSNINKEKIIIVYFMSFAVISRYIIKVSGVE